MAKSTSTGQGLTTAKRAGRPAGRKNNSTLKREALREEATDILSAKIGKVVQVVLNQAIEEGCRQSQKMILDRILPAVKSVDSKEGDALKEIHINFGTYTGGAARPFVETVDGEFTNESE